MKTSLQKIEAFLKDSFPELAASLNPPASEEQIQALEDALQKPLPEDLKNLYRWHNGESESFGFFFGLPFLSIEDAWEEWKTWAEIADEGNSTLDSAVISIPSDFVKENYANRFYLPIGKDYGGNNIAVDLDPDEKGIYGQLINSGRDEEMRYVIALSISDFMKFVLFHLQSNNFVFYKEDDVHIWFLKTPQNTHFLDTLSDLDLPFGVSKDSLEKEGESFEVWYASLSDTWKTVLLNHSKKLDDFAAIGKLKSLNLLREGIEELKPIEKFTGLRELILSANPIKDIDSLKHLKELKKLYLSLTAVEDVSVLKDLPNLSELNLFGLKLKSLDGLLGLKKLKRLSVESTSLTDLTAIEKLKSLRELDISKNSFRSFEGLSKLTNLISLNLSNTNIQNIGCLTSLQKLKNLTLYDVEASDFSPLKQLSALQEVTCDFKDFLQIKEVLDRKINFAISGDMTEEQEEMWHNYLSE
ncbi:MAG: leucine-rich repeat domain-containing protein [Chitinophagales bacterium]